MILFDTGEEERNRIEGGCSVSVNFFLMARDSKAREACRNLIKLDPLLQFLKYIIVNTCMYVCNSTQSLDF